MYRVNVLGAVSLLGLSVVLSGCGSGDGDTPEGRARVINALTNVPGNANADVNINNGQGVLTNIAYGSASPASATVNAGGAIPVKVVATGTTTTLANSSGVNITQGVDNLLLVTGVSGASGLTAPQITSLGQVDLSNPPVSNQARIYFINAAPGSADANFDLTVTNPSAPITSTASVNNLSYNQMAAAQIVTIIDGTSTVALNVSSTGQTLPVNTTAIAGGNTYAVVLTGRPTAAGGPPFSTQIIRLNP